MVRSRRSLSKEDVLSVLTDSGISLSSPSANEKFCRLNEDEEEAILDELCITDDEKEPDIIEVATGAKVFIIDNDESDISAEGNKYKTTNLNGHKQEESEIEDSETADSPVLKLRKTYVCDICQKHFRGKSDLTRHKFIHTSEKPYKCDQCSKCYRQDINLKNHIISAHMKKKEFQCKECPKTFALKERLRLHMRVHTGEKPYACKQCNKRFARGGQLNQHIVTHHPDSHKPFKCEICSSRYSTSSNLKAHLKCHEETPDFFCEICREHFANEVVLKAHVRKLHFKLKQLDCGICQKPIEEHELTAHLKTHANCKTYVCDICNSMFSQKSQFNVHLRMHSGERPFQCRICCQTFAHSSVLKLHVRKHTGEKPFQCLLCKDEVAFSQLAHLKTHMKKIHHQFKPYMCEGCHDFFKIKIDLDDHKQSCKEYKSNTIEKNNQAMEEQLLSHIRLLMAILLKRISSEQKLQQLGFEKRLIDNVVVAALKLSNRNVCEDPQLSLLQRMENNVEEFLKWIVPPKVMDKLREESQSIDSILEKIVSMYMKQK